MDWWDEEDAQSWHRFNEERRLQPLVVKPPHDIDPPNAAVELDEATQKVERLEISCAHQAWRVVHHDPVIEKGVICHHALNLAAALAKITVNPTYLHQLY